MTFHLPLFSHFFSSRDSTQVHCVNLGESFPTSIYLQNLASIQPRTSLVKLARSPCTDPPGARWASFPPWICRCSAEFFVYSFFFSQPRARQGGASTSRLQTSWILSRLHLLFSIPFQTLRETIWWMIQVRSDPVPADTPNRGIPSILAPSQPHPVKIVKFRNHC